MSSSASAAPAGSASPANTPALSPKELFAPDPDARFPNRAILATYGPLRFEAAGVHVFPPNVPGGLAMHRKVTVFESTGDLLRVSLVGQRAVRLAAYLEARDFADVVTTKTTLLLADGTAPKRAKLEARPGMIVAGTQVKDGRRITAFDDSYVWMDLSVPVAAIGKVYPAQSPPPLRHAIVAADEPLLDGPGGPRIGTVAHTDAPVETLGAPEAGHQHIALGGPTVRVEAWVRAKAVTAYEERLPEPYPGAYFLSTAEILAWLPAGTALLAEPGGPEVARCEAPVGVTKGLFGEKDGHTSIRLPFEGWTYVGFWVSDEVVAKAIAARKAAEQRLPRIKLTEKVGAGLSSPHFELTSKYPVAGCLAEAEAGSAAISGRLDVTIVVGPKGKPAKVTVSSKSALDPKLVACVGGAFDTEVHTEDGAVAKTGTIDVTIQIKAP
ncbi:MAG: hypothetical protein JSR82_11855 [Verrucomicrobia bacterium]|nr:hypothetical protein [Verrucomicrobiota bacterium]